MWHSGKEPCQCRRCRFNPWVRKILWKRKWQPTQVFLLEKLHGQGSLAGYRPWDCKETDNDWATNTLLPYCYVAPPRFPLPTGNQVCFPCLWVCFKALFCTMQLIAAALPKACQRVSKFPYYFLLLNPSIHCGISFCFASSSPSLLNSQLFSFNHYIDVSILQKL